MSLGNAFTGPVITNPQVARVSAILTAAWDAAPIVLAPAGMLWMMLYFTYTRGGVGGEVDIQMEGSPFALDASAPNEIWFPQSLYASGAMVAGTIIQSRFQEEYITYGAVGAAAEPIAYGPVLLMGCVERVRFPARESGAEQTPGELEIIATFFRG